MRASTRLAVIFASLFVAFVIICLIFQPLTEGAPKGLESIEYGADWYCFIAITGFLLAALVAIVIRIFTNK